MQRWGHQKRFREGARDVEERKSNRQCSLATVGNLLLTEARDSEELKKAANPFRPHRLRFVPRVVDSLYYYV